MYHLLSAHITNKIDIFSLGFIDLTRKADLFWLLFTASAFFVFGLFVGKNNPKGVQALGEAAEKDASEASSAIAKDIEKK